MGQDARARVSEFPLAERLRRVFGELGGCGRSRGVHRTTRNPPPRGQLSRGIPEAAGRARDCLRRAVRVGLKSVVPPFQGSGIGLDSIDPGRWPGLCCLAPLGLTFPHLKTQPYRLLDCSRAGRQSRAGAERDFAMLPIRPGTNRSAAPAAKQATSKARNG